MVAPDVIPVVEQDSLKATAWNAFRATLTIAEKLVSAVPFAHFGEIVGGLIAVLKMLDVRAAVSIGKSLSPNSKHLIGGRRES